MGHRRLLLALVVFALTATTAAARPRAKCPPQRAGTACRQRRAPPPDPPREPWRPATPAPVLDALTKDDIRAAIAAVRPAVDACARPGVVGVVQVTVTVAPAGSVSRVALRAPAPDADLGACVVAAVGHARFRATAAGGGFSYPFRF